MDLIAEAPDEGWVALVAMDTKFSPVAAGPAIDLNAMARALRVPGASGVALAVAGWNLPADIVDVVGGANEQPWWNPEPVVAVALRGDHLAVAAGRPTRVVGAGRRFADEVRDALVVLVRCSLGLAAPTSGHDATCLWARWAAAVAAEWGDTPQPMTLPDRTPHSSGLVAVSAIASSWDKTRPGRIIPLPEHMAWWDSELTRIRRWRPSDTALRWRVEEPGTDGGQDEAASHGTPQAPANLSLAVLRDSWLHLGGSRSLAPELATLLADQVFAEALWGVLPAVHVSLERISRQSGSAVAEASARIVGMEPFVARDEFASHLERRAQRVRQLELASDAGWEDWNRREISLFDLEGRWVGGDDVEFDSDEALARITERLGWRSISHSPSPTPIAAAVRTAARNDGVDRAMQLAGIAIDAGIVTSLLYESVVSVLLTSRRFDEVRGVISNVPPDLRPVVAERARKHRPSPAPDRGPDRAAWLRLRTELRDIAGPLALDDQ